MKRQFTRRFSYLYSAHDSSATRADPRSRRKGNAHCQGSACRLTINLGVSCCFAAATLAAFGSAHAQSTDDSLRIYAVNIIQDPPQSWTGYGIYLGRGLVITAAHVVGRASQTKPSVRIAGLDLPANAIKEGSFERVDLTLLSVDEQKLPVSLRMRRMPLCEKLPLVGAPVIVAVPEGTVRSRIMSPKM